MRRLTVALAIVVALTATAHAAPSGLRGSFREAYDSERVVTILAIGSDIGPPQRPGNPLNGRADALHLIAVDTRTARVTIVDFPRDSVIGGTKVNAHLSLGGPDAVRRQISAYANMRIDYYVVTSFQGLRRMVNAIDGVRIDVPHAIRDSNSKANLRAGRQNLSGKEALAFTRSRKTLAGGDFARTRNQGKVLIAAQRKVRRMKPSLGDVTRLVAAFSRNTETDMGVPTMLRLATLAQRVKGGDIRHVSLGGSIGSLGGSSVVHLHGNSVFNDIRRGRIGR